MIGFALPPVALSHAQLCGASFFLQRNRLKCGATRGPERPDTFVHKSETGDRRIDPIEFVRWCRACGQDPARCISELGYGRRS